MNLVKGRAERSWQVHAEAADEFRRKVRAELGIPGSLLPPANGFSRSCQMKQATIWRGSRCAC
jgi:hypothetical protein